jgi:hypothetical protein
VIAGYSAATDLPIARALAQQNAAKAMIGVGASPEDIPLKIQKETGKPFPIAYAYLTTQPNIGSPTTPGVQKFKDAYDKNVGKDPSTLFATQALAWWDQPLHMLAAAMGKAQTTSDPAKVSKALAALHDSTFIEDYHFDSKQQAVYGTDVATVIDGKVEWHYYPPSAS